MELARGGLLGRIEGGVELFDCDSDDNMKECWVPFKIINNGRSNDGQQMSPKISIMRVGTDWFTTLKPETSKQDGSANKGIQIILSSPICQFSPDLRLPYYPSILS